MRILLPLTALLAALLLAGCAASAGPGPAPRSAAAANPCEDPTYERLRALDPNALSEREWQRLRELEAQCREYRIVDNRGGWGWHAMHGWGPAGWAAMLVLMGAMMATL